MRQLTAALLVWCACLLTTRPTSAEPVPPPCITTTGESIIYVTPDEVIVSVGVETFDKDLDKAKTDNDERSTKLLHAIKDLGVEDKHVQTDTMHVEIQYKSDRVNHTIDGYYARRAYSITLKDVKKFERLIDVSLKNGANRLMGFEYKTTELRKHRDEARKMAIKAAKEKAVLLAGELDAKVGKPRSIQEGASFGGYRGGWYGYFGGNSFANAQNSVQAVGGGAGDVGDTLRLGQIEVRASVSVTFDLE